MWTFETFASVQISAAKALCKLNRLNHDWLIIGFYGQWQKQHFCIWRIKEPLAFLSLARTAFLWDNEVHCEEPQSGDASLMWRSDCLLDVDLLTVSSELFSNCVLPLYKWFVRISTGRICFGRWKCPSWQVKFGMCKNASGWRTNHHTGDNVSGKSHFMKASQVVSVKIYFDTTAHDQSLPGRSTRTYEVCAAFFTCIYLRNGH